MGTTCCNQSPALLADEIPANTTQEALSGLVTPSDARADQEKEQNELAKKEQEDRAKKEQEEKERKERERQEQMKQAREKREREEREEKERLERDRLEKLGPLGKPGARLQVMLDDGWKDCDNEQVKQMCDQIAGGMTKFGITSRGHMYIIDWDKDKGTQTHAHTKKSRQLRVL
eukprot:TRINITY_DN73719_c0_g1_i1.p1 TRINITY_DN73719_c0_g1~~TRINITY_DN73719_c0_g1_i1.p1  ORF type:complete len:174 (+),score=39.53 TRINITY_DN73719_c0_g1_i1:75-596(+)